VKMKDKYLLFEKDVRIPFSQLTAWVSPLSKKQYTIGSLWLYLESRVGNITDYMNKVSEYGVDNVVVSDREQIYQYFNGKISES
jgi:hypothetical protein